MGDECGRIVGIETQAWINSQYLKLADAARSKIEQCIGEKILRELVTNAGIAVTNSSFDTIYYETTKTIQIAREMGLVKGTS